MPDVTCHFMITLFPVLRIWMIFVSIACLFSCANKSEKNVKRVEEKVIPSTSPYDYSKVYGTWVNYSKFGFTIIEIIDTTNATFQTFLDRRITGDSTIEDRYYYYKSKAKIGYRHIDIDPKNMSPRIWVSTDMFRFDYKLKKDTLIEYDKMGDQMILIRIKESN